MTRTATRPVFELYAPGHLIVEAKPRAASTHVALIDEGKTPLEGCNSQRTGDTRRRGIPHTYPVQNGWTDDGRRIMRPHTNTPIDTACGHLTRATATGCAGCINRHRD